MTGICPEWIKLLATWKAAKVSQAATDQSAADRATIDALEQRAKTNDEVRRMPDDDVTRELQQWERPGPDVKP